MIAVKKKFTLPISEVGNKLRVENNNLDISELIAGSGFEAVRLGDRAKAHRNNRSGPATRETRFKYVQISDIDVQLGRIRSYKSVLGKDAPNNARRIMKHGDILVSTRRPTRGAVIAVPEEFDGDICSVFFTTLRIEDWNLIDPWYLALYLRTSLARFQFQSAITETAYPVISDADVEDLAVLLPDIAEQRRLAESYERGVQQYIAKLNEAYGAVTGARQEVEDAVLGSHAEKLEAPSFHLWEEEDVEDKAT